MVELMIFAGGRWRSLDVATGRVTGWRRRARVVVSRAAAISTLPRSRLRRLLPRLRAGAALPRRERRAKSPAQKRKHRTSDSEGHSGTVRKKTCTIQTLPPLCIVTKQDACIQTETESLPPRPTTPTFPNDAVHSKPNASNSKPRDAETKSRDSESKRYRTHRSNGPETEPLRSDSKPQRADEPRGPHSKPRLSESEHSKPQSLKERNNNFSLPLPDIKQRIQNFKRLKKRRSLPTSSSSDEAAVNSPSPAPSTEGSVRFKELVVDENDVQLIRRYLRRRTLALGPLGPVSLRRLDTDPAYKSLVFYSLNPLVHLERSKAIADILARRAKPDVESFARQLGLRSVSSAAASGGESSRERRAKPRRREPQATAAEARGSDVENHQPRALPRIKVPKRSSVPPGREFSPLEDQAIVAWLSAGDRARGVNGNSVWRDLQTQYTAITGAERSWHSLRNRYLRYILPSLHALALPPDQAARLRAAAATGMLKARIMQSRQNSIYAVPATRSASSRRPLPRPAASPEASRCLEPAASPVTSPRLRSARKRKQEEPRGRSPSSPPSSPTASPSSSPPPRSPRYSEVTRRFALRPRSTPNSAAPEPPESPPPVALRTRRLYNPAAAL